MVCWFGLTGSVGSGRSSSSALHLQAFGKCANRIGMLPDGETLCTAIRHYSALIFGARDHSILPLQ